MDNLNVNYMAQGKFIDKTVYYFCKNRFPTKSMMFDKLALESIGEQMKEQLEDLRLFLKATEELL